MANFIPPQFPKISYEGWPRGGIRGLLRGALFGALVSAAAYGFTDSYWCFSGIPLFAWVGYEMRHPPKSGLHRQAAEPPNVLW